VNAFEDMRPSIEEEAADDLVQQLHGEWAAADQTAFEARL
jgi:hypothetical protein